MPRRSRTFRSLLLGVLVSTAVLTWGLSSPLAAAIVGNTPARPAPPELWDELEPVDPDPLPVIRDNSDHDEFTDESKDPAENFWRAIDIENEFIFTAGSHKLQVWNPQADPENPSFVGEIGFTAWPQWCNQFEIQFILEDLDLAPGDDSAAAIVGTCLVGLAIIDTTDKEQPRLAYQDADFDVSNVYAARIGGTSYAIAAGQSKGARIYDMTKARQLNACLEASQACTGVFKGTLGQSTPVVAVGGVDQFVALGLSSNGLEIWDASSPTSPKKRLTESFGDVVGAAVESVAMWRTGDRYLLGMVMSSFVPGVGLVKDVKVFDVSCVAGSTACSLGQELYSQRVGPGQSRLDVSRSNGIPFLYVGSTNRKAGGVQREWVLNVADPFQIRDITPQQTISADGAKIGYWGWYYEGNPSGFNLFAPRGGQFLGEYLYRAGSSIFDIHRRTGGSAPIADFDYTSREPDGKVYPGSLVDFQDLSGGAPSEWTWSFEDGKTSSGSSTSFVQHPQGISFTSQGDKRVTLIATNDIGSSDPLTRLVPVLDPAPRVGAVTSNLTEASVCQNITLEAEGPEPGTEVTGKSPLTFDWKILDSSKTEVGETVTGERTATWQVSQGLLVGDYTAQVTVSNTQGTASAESVPITIKQLDPLPSADFPIEILSQVDGRVEFHVNAPGATEWRWDFGDGTPAEFTSDPVAGPSPVHTYTKEGTFNVTVEVRNCKEGPVKSATREVVIDQLTPLVACFKSVGLFCTASGCFGDVGEPITFEDCSTGAEVWEYDWDGDGSFDETSIGAPTSSHTYLQEGNFRPKLRVSRGEGAQTDEFEHRVISVSEPDPPPAIFVSGPSSGVVGTPYSFSASCADAGSNGWSWSTTGGSISGGSTGPQITVTWSSPGLKVVRASHFACTSGQRTISISKPDDPDDGPDGGGPNEPLDAAFTFSPTSPDVGEPVSFDASASTGATNLIWEFGDGGPTQNGVKVQHTYGEPGTYEVLLTATQPGTGVGCIQGICFSEETKTIVVGGDDTPPPPPEDDGPVCPDDPNDLCLIEGRFRVEVSWANQRNGEAGTGKPLEHSPLGESSDNTGFFYFFNPNNTELIVKMIDGRDVNNSFWFFRGGLSDVDYTITVTDQETGAQRLYHNDPGSICGEADINAFPQDDLQVATQSSLSLPVIPLGDRTHTIGGDEPSDPPADDPGGDEPPPTSGPCEPGPETICLLDGRYEVEVEWTNQRVEGESGTGKAVPGTDQTGYFWFFNPENIELVTKIIDGHPVNGHTWFFYGALTDVEYDIFVTDLDSGVEKVYRNEPGEICGRADVRAF